MYLAFTRPGHPVTTEPSVAKESEESCGSAKQFVGGNVEIKCVGNSRNDIETDAHICRIDECPDTNARPVRDCEIFRPDLRWR